MSETDKPDTPPAAASEAKPELERTRPEHQPGKPPSLDVKEGLARGPRLRDLDAEIEGELDAIMGAQGTAELMAEAAKAKRARR